MKKAEASPTRSGAHEMHGSRKKNGKTSKSIRKHRMKNSPPTTNHKARMNHCSPKKNQDEPARHNDRRAEDGIEGGERVESNHLIEHAAQHGGNPAPGKEEYG